MMKTSILSLVCFSLVCTAPVLLGQEDTKPAATTLGPRSFLPREYTKEIFVDVDQMQDTALWAALERSPVGGSGRMQFKRMFGFRVENLLKFRAVSRYVKAEEGGKLGAREAWVTILEGKGLKLPPEPKVKVFAWRRLQVAGHDVNEERGGGRFGTWYVRPSPESLVFGDTEMIGSVLRGKRRGGVIDARLMALTALRKPLAYVAVAFPSVKDERYSSVVGLDAKWLSESDPLRHARVLLSPVPKAEDLDLEVRFRFATGKKGPKRFGDVLQKEAEALKQTPLYPMIKGYLDKAKFQTQGPDYTILLRLTPKDMTNLIGPTGMMSLVFTQLQPGQPIPVGAAGPVAVPAPKQIREKPASRPAKKAKTGRDAKAK